MLSDAEKRQRYDRLGKDWQQWAQTGQRPEDFDWSRWTQGYPGGSGGVRYGTVEDLQDLFGGAKDSSFSDFFDLLFGGGMGRRGTVQSPPRQPRPYEQPVEISLAEAYQGAMRVLQMEGRRLEVRIPAGADNGTRVRIPGAAAGVGGGDLHLLVSVPPDPRFERTGEDLHTEAHADLYTALLGGEISVRTPDGRSVMLRIPPETQNAQTFRLRGRGMPRLNDPNARGDLFVKVQVQLPTQLTENEKRLFQQLRDLRG